MTVRPCSISVIALQVLAVLACSPQPLSAHGDLHKRIKKLSQQIGKTKKDSDRAPLLLKRAELHRLHRDWPAARRDYTKSRGIDPKAPMLDFLEGRMETQAGQALIALRFLNTALAKSPRHVQSRIWRGRVRAMLDRNARALVDFDVALQHAKSASVDHYFERARIQLRMKLPVTEVLRGLDEGVVRLGPISTLQEFAVDLEVEHGLLESALRRVDVILPTLPLRSPWLVRRAEILVHAGRRGEATTMYREALAEIRGLRRRNEYQIELRDRIREGLRKLDGVTAAR